MPIYKAWDVKRETRKAVAAGSFEEFAKAGMENEEMNLVITGDSQRSDAVEHEEYSSQSLCKCLTCYSTVGYLKSHAERHFQETGHTKFLELYSGQVWVFGKLDEHAGQQEVSSLEDQILKKGQDEIEQLKLKVAKGEEERKKMVQKYTQVAARAEKLESDLQALKESNKHLAEDQKLLEEQFKQTEARLQEEEVARKEEVRKLQKQIADFRRFLGRQQQAIVGTLDEMRQDLEDSQAVVGEGSSPTHQLYKPP